MKRWQIFTILAVLLAAGMAQGDFYQPRIEAWWQDGFMFLVGTVMGAAIRQHALEEK